MLQRGKIVCRRRCCINVSLPATLSTYYDTRRSPVTGRRPPTCIFDTMKRNTIERTSLQIAGLIARGFD